MDTRPLGGITGAPFTVALIEPARAPLYPPAWSPPTTLQEEP